MLLSAYVVASFMCVFAMALQYCCISSICLDRLSLDVVVCSWGKMRRGP